MQTVFVGLSESSDPWYGPDYCGLRSTFDACVEFLKGYTLSPNYPTPIRTEIEQHAPADYEQAQVVNKWTVTFWEVADEDDEYGDYPLSKCFIKEVVIV